MFVAVSAFDFDAGFESGAFSALLLVASSPSILKEIVLFS